MQAANVVPLKRFYVYELQDANGQAFYVGKGTGTRALTHLNNSHNKLVREFFIGVEDGLTIKILSWHQSSKDAEAEETRVIQSHPEGQLFNYRDTERRVEKGCQTDASELTTVSLRLPAKIWAQISTIAAEERRSGSAQVIRALEEWLDARRAK